jgi:hypothetical protein
LFSTGAAQANTITITPAASTVNLGDNFTLRVLMDFTDTTVGGGITLNTSSSDGGAITLMSIIMDPVGDLGDDPDFRCPGSLVITCPPDPNFLSFGNFSGITGQHTIADLLFKATSVGVVDAFFNITNPFSDTSGGALSVNLVGAMTIVPEPGTFSMLSLGLLGLSYAGRRRR